MKQFLNLYIYDSDLVLRGVKASLLSKNQDTKLRPLMWWLEININQLQ